MGSKPDTSAADQANAMAAQEAERARQKEIERQQRLDTGYSKIKGIFEGSPVMKAVTKNLDWSGLSAPTAANAAMRAQAAQGAGGTGVWGAGNPATLAKAAGSALPAGFEWVQTGPKGGTAPTAPGAVPIPGRNAMYGNYTGTSASRPGTHMENVGSNKAVGNPEGKDYWMPVQNAAGRTATGAPGGGQVWAIKGPDGKIYYQGDAVTYADQVDTGKRTGGFGDEFYGGIGKAVTDLGTTDITDQYNKARENLQYALARQGITTSSMANQGATDVEKAKAKAQGDLALQAKDAESQVRSQVDAERQAAISQLYATEDPTIAANTALTKAQNIRADQPDYNSLGDIFGSVINAFGNVGSAARAAGFGYQKSPSARSASGV